MNKNRIILLAIGGGIGLILLVMLYLVWSAYAAKVAALEGDDEESVAGLETVLAKANTLSRKAVYPGTESVRAINSNATLVAAWKTEAMKLATRGDRVYEATTPAAFKTFIAADAKRLGALPGFAAGAIMKSDFAFGPFREYLAEGKMPADSDLKELQRRWDDFATVIEVLSQSGAAEVIDLQVKAAAQTEEEAPKEARKRPAKRSNRKEAPKAEGPKGVTYVVTFLTRASGLVKTVNALATSERFAVVEDFAITREKDAIVSALGGTEKKEEASSRQGRSRRRRGAVVEEKPTAEEPKNGIVTDPALDAPFKVVLTVATYDFGSLDETKETKEEAQQ